MFYVRIKEGREISGIEGGGGTLLLSQGSRHSGMTVLIDYGRLIIDYWGGVGIMPAL